MLSRLLFLLALIAFSSSVWGAELEQISEDLGCYPEDGAGEFGWVIRDEATHNEVCIFAQFPRGKSEHPYVRVQGKNIKLSRISERSNLPGRWKAEEVFINRAAKLKVHLKSRLARDSCEEVQDQCCGQEYEGLLEVSDPGGRKVYKVTRWSGS